MRAMHNGSTNRGDGLVAGVGVCRAFRSATHDTHHCITLLRKEVSGSSIPHRLAGNRHAGSDTLSDIDCVIVPREWGRLGLLNRSLQTRKFRISRPRSLGRITKLTGSHGRATRHCREISAPFGALNTAAVGKFRGKYDILGRKCGGAESQRMDSEFAHCLASVENVAFLRFIFPPQVLVRE